MEELKDQIVHVSSFVRLEDGLLSKAKVRGEAKQMSEYHVMQHELSKARQYSKLRAGRSSRMNSWMQAQEVLAAKVASEEVLEEGALLPVKVCRPLSSPKSQFVLFQSKDGEMACFQVGMIMSVYRGSVSKSQATSRRISLSKLMSMASPAPDRR